MDSNLRPILNFSSNALEEKQRGFALAINSPNLSNFSHEKRLKPWLADTQDAEIVIDSGCLSLIALYTNDKWQKSLAFRAILLEISS